MPRLKFLAKMMVHLAAVYFLFAVAHALYGSWPEYWYDLRTWDVWALFYGVYVFLAGGYAAQMTAAYIGWRNMPLATEVMLETARAPVVDDSGRCVTCSWATLEDDGFNVEDVGSSPDINHHTEGCLYLVRS